MHKTCFVIIPNWNGIDLIADCLSAVQAQTAQHRVIVVDNGSSDGSNRLVRDKFPEVQLIEFSDNAGFAGGVNRGIEPAMAQGAGYIALLNNDAVPDKRWLEYLIKAMESNANIGAVAAKILSANGTRIDSTGDFYSTWGFPFPRGRDEVDQGQYDDLAAREVFAVSGGASLYRAAMFEKVGLFDERFFAYYEDVDIGFRGQLLGWKMIYEPRSVVRHYVGATSSRIDNYSKDSSSRKGVPQSLVHKRPSAFARYHSVKNFSYLYTKNMPGRLYWKYLPRFWTSWLMMAVSDLKRGFLVTNMKANAAALRKMPAILSSRHSIQRNRKVRIDQIERLLYHHLPPLQRLRFQRLGVIIKGSRQ